MLATAFTKTGAPADKLLLREIRPVVNSEVKFSSQGVGQSPTVDPVASYTLHAEAFLGEQEANASGQLRTALGEDEAPGKLRHHLLATASNAALLLEVQRNGGLS